MSMTARLWSISALSVELDMDRRTIGAGLRGVRPDGELRGNAAWFLSTALRALHSKGAPQLPPVDEPPPPVGFEILTEIENPTHAAMAVGWLGAIYSLGRVLHHVAPQAGYTPEQAKQIASMATAALIGLAEKELRDCGCEPFVSESDPVWISRLPFDWLGDDVEAEEDALVDA
jgi:hypothetical protein